jgi:SAM-dependent methyltransferase
VLSLPVNLVSSEAETHQGVVCSLLPGEPAVDEAQLLGSFVAAHYPDHARLEAWSADELMGNPLLVAQLATWVEGHAPDGPALDLGCGPGRFTFELCRSRPAIGMDLRMTLLSFAAALRERGRSVAPMRVEGERWSTLRVDHHQAKGSSSHFVLGDACNPPFEDGSFAVVSALMLLDTVPEPDHLLVRASDMLAPGGVLLVTSSYSWNERNTPRERWWSDGPATLRTRLSDLGLRRLEERDDLVWTIPGTERTVFRYRLHAVLARKLSRRGQP